MEKNILIEDLDASEENMFVDVKYKGVAFTGIGYEDSEYRHSEYSYVNGFGHGRSFSVYPNGQLEEEFFLENGVTIQETDWYKSGVKKKYFRREPFLIQRWNEEGVLLKEENAALTKEWFPSAKLKSEFVKKNEFTYYGEDGEWAVKIKTQEDYVVHDKNEMTFNESYISGRYMNLLQDHDFYKYFIIWLDNLEAAKREEVICNMIRSDILWHKYDGINLASKYKVYQAVPCIKNEVGNHKTPPTMHDLDGYGSIGFGHTIAQRAEIALKSLKNNL